MIGRVIISGHTNTQRWLLLKLSGNCCRPLVEQFEDHPWRLTFLMIKDITY